MAPPHTNKSPQKEGRMDLAIYSIEKNQIKSGRQAAKVFKVSRTTLQRRRKGIGLKQGSRPANSLLLLIEEKELVRWILSLERRSFPPHIIDVKRLAEGLISRRGSREFKPIGKYWIYRFLTRHPAIKQRLTRSKDSNRALQESPRVMKPWFEPVDEAIKQYGIADSGIYNCDETGFAMGLISGSKAAKVVTSSENVGRATVFQPGSRKWITTIECVNAMDHIIPPFIIADGKFHLRYWYDQHRDLELADWIVAISDNGWINDERGFDWIQHFDKHTKDCLVGSIVYFS
jgi:hypothetical protein